MHYYTRFVAIAILSIFILSIAQSQWVPTSGPEGGNVTSLSSQGSSILAATYSGIFLSTDQGASWSSYNEGITDFSNNFNKALFFNGTEMLVATTRTGILVRQIGGLSWQPQNTGLPTTFVSGLGAHGGTLFAGPAYAGIYRSSDNGSSWTKADSGLLASTFTYDFYSDGPIVWAATTTGVYRSSDDGLSWSQKSSGLACLSVWSVTKVGTTLMSGTCDGIYISTDGGDNWTKKDGGIGIPTYYGFAVTPAGVFASTFGAVSVSTDTGATWAPLLNGLPNDYFDAITSIGNKLILGGSYTGIFASSDDGLSWSPSNAGLRVAASLRILAHGTGIIAGTGSGLFRSTDAGVFWSAIHPAGVPYVVGGLAADNQYLYAAVAPTYSTVATYRSTDEGAHWDSVQTGLPSYLGLYGIHTIGSMLFASTTSGLYGSMDHGSTWARTGIPVGLTPTRSLTGTPDMIFAATSRGAFVSSDSGKSWLQRNNGLLDSNLSCINYSGGYLLAGTYGSGLYRSTDSAATWGSPGSIAGSNGFANIGQTTFLTSYYGLRRSTDHGLTWSQSGTGLVDSASYGIAEKNGYLFLATGTSGVWKRLKDELVTDARLTNTGELPGKFSLAQNFPNPFNPSTNIRYALQVAGFVTLKIYDLLGKEIATLVNRVEQPGTYFATWNGSSAGNEMPSGVYFYRLEIRAVDGTRGTTVTETKKLILMR